MKKTLYQVLMGRFTVRWTFFFLVIGSVAGLSYMGAEIEAAKRAQILALDGISAYLETAELNYAIKRKTFRDRGVKMLTQVDKVIDQKGLVGLNGTSHEDLAILVLDTNFQVLASTVDGLMMQNIRSALSLKMVRAIEGLRSSQVIYTEELTKIPGDSKLVTADCRLASKDKFIIIVYQQLISSAEAENHVGLEKLMAVHGNIRGLELGLEPNLEPSDETDFDGVASALKLEGENRFRIANPIECIPNYSESLLVRGTLVPIFNSILLGKIIIATLIWSACAFLFYKRIQCYFCYGTRDASEKLVKLLRYGAVGDHEMIEGPLKSIEKLLSEVGVITEAEQRRANQLEVSNMELTNQREVMKEQHVALTQLQRELENLVHANQRGYYATIRALTRTIEYKDILIHGHSERVEQLAVRLGKKIGLKHSELETLSYGALLHDIGKLGLPEDVIKWRGPSDHHFSLLKQQHAQMGFEIIQDLHFLNEARLIVLQHHEHFDGTGYPFGLKGDQIHLLTRILSICDGFDTKTTDRNYGNYGNFGAAVLSEQEALSELRYASGTQYDPELVEAFVSMVQME